MTRSRDYAYESLAEATGSSQTAARGELNAALKSIKEQSGIEDSYLLADEIHVRAKLYRQVMPDVILTPSALAKHWLRVFEEAEQRKTKGTNVHAPATHCKTCDGDRFVVVNLRPAKPGITGANFEEWAACPDCHSVDASFVRYGSRFVPPDPARVRQILRDSR